LARPAVGLRLLPVRVIPRWLGASLPSCATAVAAVALRAVALLTLALRALVLRAEILVVVSGIAVT
jgi:hypothetical protein